MLSNSDIQKLLTVLASKEDLKNLATKEDLNEVKEDLNEVKEDLNEVKEKLGKMQTELKDLNQKVDTIVVFMHEVDDDTNRRLKRVEKHLDLPLMQT